MWISFQCKLGGMWISSGCKSTPESTKLETLFKILAALDLELHVVKRDSTLDENNTWKKEW